MVRRRHICARLVMVKKTKGQKLNKEEKRIVREINKLKRKYC